MDYPVMSVAKMKIALVIFFCCAVLGKASEHSSLHGYRLEEKNTLDAVLDYRACVEEGACYPIDTNKNPKIEEPAEHKTLLGYKNAAAKDPERKEIIEEIIAEPENDVGFVGSLKGIPGVHYPNYAEVPITKFSCSDKKYIPGFYADMETGCQVFHVCYEHRRESFLCPPGTIFNQPILACDYWYSSDCSKASLYYDVNKETSDIEVSEKETKPEKHFQKIDCFEENEFKDLVKFLPVKAKIIDFPKDKTKVSVSSLEGIEEIASNIFGEVIPDTLIAHTREIKLVPKPQQLVIKPNVVKPLPLVKTQLAVKTLPSIRLAKPKIIAPSILVAKVPTIPVKVPIASIPLVKAMKITAAAIPVKAVKIVAASVPLVKAKKVAAAAIPIKAAKVAAASLPLVKAKKIAAAAIPVKAAKIAAKKVAAATIPIKAAKIAAASVPLVKAKKVAAATIPVKAAKITAKKVAAASVPLLKAKKAASIAIPVAKATKFTAKKAAAIAIPVAKATKFKAKKAAAIAIPVATATKLAAKKAAPVAIPLATAVKIVAATVPLAKAKKVTAAAIPVATVAKAAAVVVPLSKAKKVTAATIPVATVAKVSAASVPIVKAVKASAAIPVAKTTKFAVASVPIAKAKVASSFAVPVIKSKFVALPKAASVPGFKAKKKAKVVTAAALSGVPVMKAKASMISPLTKKGLALGYKKLLKAKKLSLMG